MFQSRLIDTEHIITADVLFNVMKRLISPTTSLRSLGYRVVFTCWTLGNLHIETSTFRPVFHPSICPSLQLGHRSE